MSTFIRSGISDKDQCHQPPPFAGRMLLFTWVGVFCGLVFWRLGEGMDAVRNRTNLLFIENLQFMLLVSGCPRFQITS